MSEQILEVRCERDRFLLPARQADERADAQPPKTSRIPTLGAVEPKIKIALWPGSMHLGVNTAIVGFLINHEPFRTCLDNRHIILSLHWTQFYRDRRKSRDEGPHAFSQVIPADELWMFTRDKENLAKSLSGEMLRF